MGMWEPKEPYYKHECKKKENGFGYYWTCILRRDSKTLELILSVPQCCHDDDYVIEVKQCPMCGYSI